MEFTDENKKQFDSETHCWLCEEPFHKEGRQHITNLTFPSVRDVVKCRHHCNLTSKYVGATHSLCNLQLKYKNRAIPVLSHNFKNYDSHLILSGINREIKVKITPSNSEHYISVMFDNNLKFIDSYQFLPQSLAELITELPSEEFKIVPQAFEDEFIPYVTGKGIFPYDYVDSFTKFEETTIPNIEQFFNSLTESELEKEDYEKAVKTWEIFGIKSLGEYSDLYLFTDVILLAEVFETFRNLCISNHRLDPVHVLCWLCMGCYASQM